MLFHNYAPKCVFYLYILLIYRHHSDRYVYRPFNALAFWFIIVQYKSTNLFELHSVYWVISNVHGCKRFICKNHHIILPIFYFVFLLFISFLFFFIDTLYFLYILVPRTQKKVFISINDFYVFPSTIYTFTFTLI